MKCLFPALCSLSLTSTFAMVALNLDQAHAANKPIEMAITFDDLPISGDEHPTITRMQIVTDIIDALKKSDIKGVYGFINGLTVKNMDDRLTILKVWKDAGFKFGNHTYSHLDLSKTFVEDYIEDIEKNEPVLMDFAGSIEELKVFRYPFLTEGDTKDKRTGIRNYFAKRRYKIAQVSVDFEDWGWGPAFVRCSKKNDKANLDELKKTYIDHAKKSLALADQMAKKIYGASGIKHILLLHSMSMTAKVLPELLEEYKKSGVKFVSLETAMTDPAYSKDNGYVDAQGKSFLLQVQEARGLDWSGLKVPKPPTRWLESVCKD